MSEHLRTNFAVELQEAKQLLLSDRVYFEETLRTLLKTQGAQFRNRCFSPIETLWIFISQVLSSDHSCRDALSQYIASRFVRNLKPCSSATGAYCKARRRLSEDLVKHLLKQVGVRLEEEVPQCWLWRNRHIKLVDGTKLSMPDTVENQKEYPQQRSQDVGCGFPVIRLMAIISLSTGAILDVATGPVTGKGTGEPPLFRKMKSSLDSGDLVVFDRIFTGYFDLALLMKNGVDFVSRQHQGREEEHIKEIKRLGKADRIIELKRPFNRSFQWLDGDVQYTDFPKTIRLREIKITISKKGFRCRKMTLITSLLDPKEFSKEDISNLFRLRWQIETDFRSIKTFLKMGVLRCKTPEMIRKEIYVHCLAYNLIRLIMCDAAIKYHRKPRELSFRVTQQLFYHFRTAMTKSLSSDHRIQLYNIILQAIVSHKIGSRADRVEPRRLKRRRQGYSFLMKPRSKYKIDLRAGRRDRKA